MARHPGSIPESAQVRDDDFSPNWLGVSFLVTSSATRQSLRLLQQQALPALGNGFGCSARHRSPREA